MDSGKFWNFVDIAKRVVILGALVVGILYVSYYFYDLQSKANKLSKNIDSVTFENMEVMRQKFQDYYQQNQV